MQPNPLQEGNSCNLREGEGETGSVEKIKSSEPKSHEVVVEQRTPSIPDQGSAVKIILKVSSESPRTNLQLLKSLKNIGIFFYQMADNQQ